MAITNLFAYEEFGFECFFFFLFQRWISTVYDFIGKSSSLVTVEFRKLRHFGRFSLIS